jgi:hypothetical protein
MDRPAAAPARLNRSGMGPCGLPADSRTDSRPGSAVCWRPPNGRWWPAAFSPSGMPPPSRWPRESETWGRTCLVASSSDWGSATRPSSNSSTPLTPGPTPGWSTTWTGSTERDRRWGRTAGYWPPSDPACWNWPPSAAPAPTPTSSRSSTWPGPVTGWAPTPIWLPKWRWFSIRTRPRPGLRPASTPVAISDFPTT